MARRSRDPNRREHIARAAVDVISRKGIERLTHRDVAEAADVPVGLTTYYFDTRDDLLHAALEISAADTERYIREWGERIQGRDDVVPALVDLVMDYAGPTRPTAVVVYELYVGAARRSRLRDLAMEWQAVTREILETHVDELTAEALTVALDGAALRGLIDPHSDRARLEALFDQVLAHR